MTWISETRANFHSATREKRLRIPYRQDVKSTRSVRACARSRIEKKADERHARNIARPRVFDIHPPGLTKDTTPGDATSTRRQTINKKYTSVRKGGRAGVAGVPNLRSVFIVLPNPPFSRSAIDGAAVDDFRGGWKTGLETRRVRERADVQPPRRGGQDGTRQVPKVSVCVPIAGERTPNQQEEKPASPSIQHRAPLFDFARDDLEPPSHHLETTTPPSRFPLTHRHHSLHTCI